jgi:hypothetical protein
MHEHTLAFFCCSLNEVVYIPRSFILLVEENLAFYVLPEECQVDHTKALPLVLYLFACAVDDPCYLVHLNEV